MSVTQQKQGGGEQGAREGGGAPARTTTHDLVGVPLVHPDCSPVPGAPAAQQPIVRGSEQVGA